MKISLRYFNKFRFVSDKSAIIAVGKLIFNQKEFMKLISSVTIFLRHTINTHLFFKRFFTFSVNVNNSGFANSIQNKDSLFVICINNTLFLFVVSPN